MRSCVQRLQWGAAQVARDQAGGAYQENFKRTGRALTPRTEEIRRLVQESRDDPRPSRRAEEVFAHLEAKYLKMAADRTRL